MVSDRVYTAPFGVRAFIVQDACFSAVSWFRREVRELLEKYQAIETVLEASKAQSSLYKAVQRAYEKEMGSLESSLAWRFIKCREVEQV